MLKNKIWRLLSPDDNTEGNSSTSSDDNGADSSQQQQDDNSQEDDEQEDSESDSDDADDSSDDGTGDDNADGDQDNDQQQDDGQEDQSQNDVQDATVDKEGDEKLRFSTHPRWKELVTEKNQFKTQLTENQPLVEQAKTLNSFLQENQIPPQEFQNALQYLVALRRDPATAFKMLQPTYEQLAMMTGERLPADLQSEVAAGTLSPERAQEIARGRAQQQHQTWRGQQQQQGQVQNIGDVVAATTQMWVSQKQVVNPDLKQGTPLWEQTDLRLRAINAANPPRSAQDALNNCEKAFQEATKFMTSLQPRQVNNGNKKLPQSRQTAHNNNQVVKTPEDVMNAIRNGRRPNQLRYA